MFIHGSAAGGTSVAADNARRCRTTDPSQDKGLRKRMGLRDGLEAPVEHGDSHSRVERMTSRPRASAHRHIRLSVGHEP